MKKVKTNNVKKLLRKSCAVTLAMVLLPHPWTTSALAQQQNAWVGAASQAIQGVTGAIQGAMMQAQMMTPIDLSQSQIRNVPAANLPAPLNKCIIPQASIEMPKYCEVKPNPGEFTSVPDLTMSQTYRAATQTKQFAEKSVEDLKRMLNMGKNEFANGAVTGIQCLDDSLKKERTRQRGILNAIQARITQVKKRNEQFKEQVKLVELQMDKVKGELHGSTSGSSRHIVDNVNPPVKSLPPACQAILESNPNFQPTSAGLLQIRDANLKPFARQGGEFLANQQIYKDDINRFIQESKNHIAKHGIDSFRGQNLDLFKGNPDLKKRLESALAPFIKRVATEEINIRNQLQSVGYEAPALDKNFKSDFETFKADSKSYFRKKFVNECVAGGNNNLTVDPEVILNSLRQEGTNNQGTTILSYKAALKNILDSDSFIEDKIEAMKVLDKNYGEGNITITLANSNAKAETKPAYVYFQQAIAMCEREYEDDKTFSSQDSGRSASVRIDRAEAYLNDLQKLHDTFAAELTTEVTNDVLNCDGRATEAGSCKAGAFAIAEPNFCFQSATSCATQVNNCFAVADQLVQEKTVELNKHADTFNGMVETLFKDQERFLAEFRASVTQEAGLLNALVPGADFTLPKDLMIAMPELELDPATNTYLRGRNSKNIGDQLANLATKMDSLKSALEQQGKAADKELQDYIANQQKNIQDNLKNFEKVANDCSNLMDAAEGIVTQFNNERQSQETEARQAAADWCRRFYDLSTNPAAGCGDSVESLYEDGARAIQFINPEGYKLVNRYNNLCRETQSEREAGTEDDGRIPLTASAEIASACSQGGDWQQAIERQKEDFLNQLNRRYNLSQQEFDDINDFISNPSDETSTAFLESLGGDLADARGLSSDLQRMRQFVTRPNVEQSVDEFVNQYASVDLELPSVNGSPTIPEAQTAAASALKSAFDRYSSAMSGSNTEAKVNAYADLVTEYNRTAAEARAPFNSVISGTLPASYNKEEALKRVRLAGPAQSALRSIASNATASETDGKKKISYCDQIAGGVWQQAINHCAGESSPGSNCVQERADELFADGSTVSRSVASLGLRSSAEAQIEDAFERIGQDKNIVCDALEASRRNSGAGSLEAFDRQILGEQYNEVMR